jgi:plasmid stabilization system protein ParE
MTDEVLVTSRARRQLTDSARWWGENRSLEQAARWLDGLEIALASLGENPQRHSLARESEIYELPFPVRQLLYGIGSKPTHRAVFEVRGNTVYVVAIRHLFQDDLAAEDLAGPR